MEQTARAPVGNRRRKSTVSSAEARVVGRAVDGPEHLDRLLSSALRSVDSAVASHLLQATRAAGLLGAECSVVGASPGIARTVIDLGIELGKLTTHRDLEAGFRYALARKGYVIAPRAARRA
ncbi:STAS domain-containing protein [Sorangium sp. So ce233]|uniref:STAS domain-containing protein n=1 Tax=Sorangium sp. So ce233 TaxID=3133290 RepID=UPI003F62856E